VVQRTTGWPGVVQRTPRAPTLPAEDLHGDLRDLGRRAADLTPWASSAAALAAAPPEEPETIAPAWPICLRGCCEAGDVTDHRLGHVLADELGGALLGVAADLTAHHDQLGLRVVLEETDDVDEVGARDRVAADTNDR